jgi:twitching motility protein PilT
MVNTPAIQALIRDNKTFRINSDIQTGGKYGMVTLDGYLMDLHTRGIISRDEVITKSQDPTTIVQKLAEWEAAQAEKASGPEGAPE